MFKRVGIPAEEALKKLKEITDFLKSKDINYSVESLLPPNFGVNLKDKENLEIGYVKIVLSFTHQEEPSIKFGSRPAF